MTMQKMFDRIDADVSYENVRMDRHSDFFCFISNYEANGEHLAVIEPHYHSYMELIYVLSSEVKITLKDQTFAAKSGELWVILPGEIHSFERKRGCKYVCIQVDPKFLLSGMITSSEMGRYMSLHNIVKPESHRVTSRELDNTDIPKSIKSLVMAYDEQKHFHRLRIRNELTKITLFILDRWEDEYFSKPFPSQEEEKIKKIAPVLELVEREYKSNLKAEELAKSIGMSNSYFSRSFSNAVGMGFTEYINYLKINEAERLIVTTDFSVEQIAREVGFSNTSYFITKFKQQFSISPKKYRQNYSRS